jgi:PII-like signaling protein
MQTVLRKRIEILADAPLLPRLVAALEQCGIDGHTIFPATAGAGRTGRWSEDGLTGTSKQLLVAIASEDHAAALVDQLAPMLDSHRLLLTVSAVEVVRGDRF